MSLPAYPGSVTDRLERLQAGMPIPFGGDRLTHVAEELAEAFQPGDQLIVVQETGDLLHVPAAEAGVVRLAVDRAAAAFLWAAHQAFRLGWARG